jgi:hypothetical protein
VDELHSVDNELFDELERMAVRTAQGSFVSMEDVRAVVRRRQEQTALEALPLRLSKEQARGLAREYLKDQQFGPQQPLEPGKAIAASET